MDNNETNKCCMDYEAAYNELVYKYKELIEENEKLKQALIKVAMRL